MSDYCVYGIDAHVSHCAFACYDGTDLHTTEFDCGRQKRPLHERLMLLYKDANYQAAIWHGKYGKPAAVAVELPTGRHRVPTLTMACGVVILAVAHALDVPVWTTSPTEWKKLTVGAGNASKDQVHDWAVGIGLPVEASEHRADATGIAVAAYRLLTGTDAAREAA